MEKAVASGFQFKNFIIEESYFKISDNSVKNIELNIGPEGEHYVDERKFNLILNVIMKNSDNTFECRIKSKGEFVFNDDAEVIPDFFYINAPAIMFPYIRAYISTLTNLSTAGHPITLPTLKIDLKEPLKSNIKVL